ncbi:MULTISPECIES: virulence factor [Burkholderia]|uniref:virulence factor n=1 Tax=Burkholderia TaxID=32008 RepID=UPI00158A0E99|nr:MULTISPECIES: virulence factor [Burkholderia]MBR7944645.1 virulence factor [Burkholderia cenocepacia]
MSALISSRPRRVAVALAILLLSVAIAATWTYHAQQAAPQPLSVEEWMKRLIVLPLLVVVAVLALWTGLRKSGGEKVAATTVGTGASVAVAAPVPNQPFRAQVVGLAWLNPLERRDYPTEWQLLWTMGLVQPNEHDDMVKEDPKGFTTLQPVAGVAYGNDGRETFDGFYEKYIDQLLVLFGEIYVMSPVYFYNVHSKERKGWRELAGTHIEFAIPEKRLDPEESRKYLVKQFVSMFEIGNQDAPSLWSKDTPPDVHITPGGPNAGFTSLNRALDYLQAHPDQSVWVMNWDAPSFPPKDNQMNENMVLLVLTGPDFKTEREPLAWVGRVAVGNVNDFEKKSGTTRAVQAWKSTIEQAAHNAGVTTADLHYVVHDAGKGSDVASARLGALSQTLTEVLPEYDFKKQTFNTPALLGEMGAGTALTDVALAIGRANHLGGNTLVAGTNDAEHPMAVVVVPPAKLNPVDPKKPWFRAAGEGSAYLPWWGKRHDVDYSRSGQGYSF